MADACVASSVRYLPMHVQPESLKKKEKETSRGLLATQAAVHPGAAGMMEATSGARQAAPPAGRASTSDGKDDGAPNGKACLTNSTNGSPRSVPRDGVLTSAQLEELRKSTIIQADKYYKQKQFQQVRLVTSTRKCIFIEANMLRRAYLQQPFQGS